MQQRKTQRSPITKSLFYAINRDIKEAPTNGNGGAVVAIALAHGVSQETVRTIRRVKTWPAFEQYKQTRHSPVSGRPMVAVRPGLQMPPVSQQDAEEVEDIKLRVGELESQLTRLTRWVVDVDKKASKRTWPWSR